MTRIDIKCGGCPRHVTIFTSGDVTVNEACDPSDAGLMSLDIGELDLTVRSYNCLLNSDITTVGRLVSHTRQQLSRLKWMGVRSLNEIEAALARNNLKLKETRGPNGEA